MPLEHHLSNNFSPKKNTQSVSWGGKKMNTTAPNSRELRRMGNKGQQAYPMVSIAHDYVENSNNKRLGDFRFIDSQAQRVTPELIHFFNGHTIQKQQEQVISREEKDVLSYLKRWQSPYGYASWPWVIHWMSRLRQDGFSGITLEKAAETLRDRKREGCLEEAHLIGDEMMENKAEPIWLTKEIADAFYNTDIPSFDADQNEILPSFVLMLPKNLVSIVDYDHQTRHSLTRDTRAILVVTNNCYRKRLRTYYDEFLKLYKEDQVGSLYRTFINDKLDPINYVEEEKDGYMFESGFKMLALDDKCGAVFADFTWKDGTKGFKVYESEDDIQTRETFKKDKSRNQNLDHNCKISDTYAGLINIVANTILTMSHHTEYVSVKSPMIPRATGFNPIGQEIPPQPATWIGEGYNNPKARYEYPDDHIPSKGVSPRAHWRRGHQRYVCQGPGRKQKVLKWIKPCYVNGNKD